jgi:hypothetical protein
MTDLNWLRAQMFTVYDRQLTGFHRTTKLVQANVLSLACYPTNNTARQVVYIPRKLGQYGKTTLCKHCCHQLTCISTGRPPYNKITVTRENIPALEMVIT